MTADFIECDTYLEMAELLACASRTLRQWGYAMQGQRADANQLFDRFYNAGDDLYRLATGADPAPARNLSVDELVRLIADAKAPKLPDDHHRAALAEAARRLLDAAWRVNDAAVHLATGGAVDDLPDELETIVLEDGRLVGLNSPEAAAPPLKKRLPAYARPLADARRRGLVPKRHSLGHIVVTFEWRPDCAPDFPVVVVPPEYDPDALDWHFVAGLEIFVMHRTVDRLKVERLVKALHNAKATAIKSFDMDMATAGQDGGYLNWSTNNDG